MGPKQNVLEERACGCGESFGFGSGMCALHVNHGRCAGLKKEGRCFWESDLTVILVDSKKIYTVVINYGVDRSVCLILYQKRALQFSVWATSYDSKVRENHSVIPAWVDSARKKQFLVSS